MELIKNPKKTLSLLIAALFLQRLPSLFVPFWTKDEGFWWAVGKAVANGGRLFVDSVDNKPPLFLGAYALSIKFFGDQASMAVLHFMVIAGQALILAMLYQLSRKYWGECVAAATGVIYLCLQGSFVSQEILAANSENLMMPWLVLSLFIYDHAKESQNSGSFFLIGIFLGIAFFIRQTALVMFGVFGLYQLLDLIFTWRTDRPQFFKKLIRFMKEDALVSLGFVVVFAGVCRWFSFQNSFDEFWYWTFTLTREYVGESLSLKIILWDAFWKTGTIFLSQALPWVLVFAAILQFKKLLNTGLLWVCFFVGMTLTVIAGWRFSHHYYLQIFPAAALLAGWALHQRILSQKNLWPMSKRVVGLCLMIPLLGFSGEAVYRCVKDPSGFPRPKIRELGMWLNQHKQENESLFVWGYYPEIYYYSGLKNAARFVEIHFLTGQIRDSIQEGGLQKSEDKLWGWLWSDLKRQPPEWFVDNTSFPVSGRYLKGLSNYPELQNFVLENYTEVNDLHGMKIFHRK